MQSDKCPCGAAVQARSGDGSQQIIRVVVEADHTSECVRDGIDLRPSVIAVSNCDIITVRVQNLSRIHGAITSRAETDACSVRQTGPAISYYAAGVANACVIDERPVGCMATETASGPWSIDSAIETMARAVCFDDNAPPVTDVLQFSEP